MIFRFEKVVLKFCEGIFQSLVVLEHLVALILEGNRHREVLTLAGYDHIFSQTRLKIVADVFLIKLTVYDGVLNDFEVF